MLTSPRRLHEVRGALPECMLGRLHWRSISPPPRLPVPPLELLSCLPPALINLWLRSLNYFAALHIPTAEQDRMTGHEVDDEPEARARMERRQVLTATAAAAEAGTLLGKSVAADARLSCPASSTAVEAGESSGVVVQAKGSATGLPSPLTKQMKKKLLILDLNGLLADINQDRHNAHLSHGTIRGKLGTYVNQISC